MTKAQLYELIKLYKLRYKAHKINVLTCHGHIVLTQPLQHPTTNYVKKEWGTVKNRITVENVMFKTDMTCLKQLQRFWARRMGLLSVNVHTKQMNKYTTKGRLDNIMQSLIWTVKMTVQNPAATICHSQVLQSCQVTLSDLRVCLCIWKGN